MTIIKMTIIGLVLVSGAGYGVCEEGRFQPAKGKTIEQTLKEAKAEHNARVSEMRAKLPLLKEQLAEEKRVGKREDIVDSLGRTEDAQSINLLVKVLRNPNENLRVRQVSAESLYKLYRPGLASGKSLDTSDKQSILIPMKEVYSKAQGELKCSLASHLYQMGEKKLVSSGILECLKAGRWGNLNAFIYGRKADGVMIQTSIPGESNPRKIDEDAHEMLKEASGTGYPEEIRVKAADMLVKLGDKDAAFNAAKDVINNGKIYEWRARALELMCKIGTPEAKSVLDHALTVNELKPIAEDILKWSWGK